MQQLMFYLFFEVARKESYNFLAEGIRIVGLQG